MSVIGGSHARSMSQRTLPATTKRKAGSCPCSRLTDTGTQNGVRCRGVKRHLAEQIYGQAWFCAVFPFWGVGPIRSRFVPGPCVVSLGAIIKDDFGPPDMKKDCEQALRIPSSAVYFVRNRVKRAERLW